MSREYVLEVAQRNGAPLGVRLAHIADDHLAHLLRVAVGAVGVHRRRLRDGNRLRRAVHGRRRGVDKTLAVVLVHRRHEVERTRDIHVVVVDRNLARLAHRLERADEDHRVDLLGAGVLGKDLVERRGIAQVTLNQLNLAVLLVLLAGIRRERLTRELLHATHRFLLGVVEVVKDWVSRGTHS